MNNNRKESDIIIIGAGFAGLAAGIYAQMNGYSTRIFEMHDKPGGLCTSWKRKGYTFDVCIHWLVGSNPGSGFYRFWEEVGIAQGRKFIDMDEYMRYECSDGRTLVFANNLDRLEKNLLEFSPADEKPIKDFIKGIRICIPFDPPPPDMPLPGRFLKKIRSGINFFVNGEKMQQWMKMTAEDFAGRLKDRDLAEAFRELWIPEFSMFFMLFTFAYLHNRNAGYPLGGSMPMSEALAERYLNLGGEINYKSRVKEILVGENRATGIVLTDGTEHLAGTIISAADGYSTIFEMLGGKFTDEKTREPYEKWPIFQPLIFVGLGVNLTFKELPLSVSGISFPLKKPVEIGDAVRERIWIHPFNHDPGMAPAGKTSIVIMLTSRHDYWKNLAADEEAYRRKKEEISRTIIEVLEERFPGFALQVESVDVATPLTFERYTGNWQGSFEGWLITPGNSGVIMKPMPQTLPGLDNFFMCGQWVEPGGGLPTSIMSGRRLVKTLCKKDRRRFRTTFE